MGNQRLALLRAVASLLVPWRLSSERHASELALGMVWASLSLLIPTPRAPSVACLSFFLGVFGWSPQAFNNLSFLLAQLSPGLESTFFAARATFSVTHVK